MLMVACSLQYFMAARQLNDKKHIVSERHWFFKLGRCSTKWVTIDCVCIAFVYFAALASVSPPVNVVEDYSCHGFCHKLIVSS